MSLKTIRTELREVDGYDSSEDSFLNRQINRAVKELYNEFFLFHAEREQIVELPQFQQQITLGWEVDKLLAARRYTTRVKLGMQDMRPRYRETGWKEPYLGYPYLKMRNKPRVALHSSYTNFGPFTVSVGAAEATDIIVTIVGETENAARIKEQVTIVAGNTSATFTKSFKDVHSFSKDRVTDNDVSLADLDGNPIAVIPNFKTEVTYPVYQVLDRYENYGNNNNFIEVLYKLALVPLTEDTDVFLDGYYDTALYYKCREYLFERDDAKTEDRIIAATKCLDSLTKVNKQFIDDGASVIKYPTPSGTKAIQKLRGGLTGRYPHEK